VEGLDVWGWIGGALAALGTLYALASRGAGSTTTPPPGTTPGGEPTPPDPGPVTETGRDVFGVKYAGGSTMPVWPLPADRRSNGSSWARGLVTTDFGDPRPFGSASPTRHHMGEDLRAPRGSVLVATERGRIVAIDEDWYDAASGEATGVVLVAMDTGIVVAYGETLPGSTRALGLNVGSAVERGAPLAQVGGTNMVHFETYAAGTTRTSRWWWKQAPPANALNPTRYLQRAAKTVPA
jgi:murein DD-endopeptidase MepM/ murein hydrolase activator NlpD